MRLTSKSPVTLSKNKRAGYFALSGSSRPILGRRKATRALHDARMKVDQAYVNHLLANAEDQKNRRLAKA